MSGNPDELKSSGTSMEKDRAGDAWRILGETLRTAPYVGFVPCCYTRGDGVRSIRLLFLSSVDPSQFEDIHALESEGAFGVYDLLRNWTPRDPEDARCFAENNIMGPVIFMPRELVNLMLEVMPAALPCEAAVFE